MMMRALSFGGLQASFNKGRDGMNTAFGDELYQPNKNGFYELSVQDYHDPNLPQKHDGRLIKVLVRDVEARMALAKSNIPYRVVFMLRNPEEIRQSFDGFYGSARQIMHVINNYGKRMARSIGRFKSSAESVDVFQYRDVVNSPVFAFTTLEKNGWPIDVEKAASVVDPDLYRFRLENLEVGIC